MAHSNPDTKSIKHLLPGGSVSFLILLIVCGFSSSGICDQMGKAPSPVIRVGGNSDFAPYEFVDDDGRPNGYTVALMQAAARQVGLDVQISLKPWSETLMRVEKGEIDALTGLLYSRERDKVFDFSVPHSVISYAVFTHANWEYKSLEDLRGHTIVLVKDVYAYEWVKANSFAARIIPVQRPGEALKLVNDGKYDFAVIPRLHGLELMRRMKLSNIKTVGPPVLTQKFCFAVAAGNSDLLARLNEGLALLQKSGEYDRIYLKWFSLYEQKRRYWRYAAYAGLITLVLVLLTLAWNIVLKQSVKHKTRALQESRMLLQQIVQGLPMPTFVVDHDQRLTHWNKACERLTGVEAVAVLGTPLHNSVFYKDQRLPLSRLVLEKASGGGPFHCQPSKLLEGACEIEYQFDQKDQESRLLYGTSAPLLDPDGKVIGAIESWQDITEHKRLETQLIQSQKMEAISTMAGGIAHDFNNMLTAIMANTVLARRASKSNPQALEALKKVLGACDHAAQLIRRMLSFSRQTEVEVRPARIDNLVSDALDLIRATLPSAMRIEREFQSSALVSVDATQFHQVLMNLCANAAHAMGGKQGTLTFRLVTSGQDDPLLPADLTSDHNTFAKISVSDTGHGIPKEIIDCIFDPFFTTKKRGEGTGMGLSVSQGIIKRFGGAITVESKVGQGTTFHIFLPVFQEKDDTATGITTRQTKIDDTQTVLS